jgi:hypothetical protein
MTSETCADLICPLTKEKCSVDCAWNIIPNSKSGCAIVMIAKKLK